jgi:hypothetical protein
VSPKCYLHLRGILRTSMYREEVACVDSWPEPRHSMASGISPWTAQSNKWIYPRAARLSKVWRGREEHCHGVVKRCQLSLIQFWFNSWATPSFVERTTQGSVYLRQDCPSDPYFLYNSNHPKLSGISWGSMNLSCTMQGESNLSRMAILVARLSL